MLRHFVRIDHATGLVDQDLEYDSPDPEVVATAPAPVAPDGKTFYEVTGHPQWAGCGSLLMTTRDADGSFRTPAPTRVIVDVGRFFDLFTFAQRSALFDLEDTDPRIRDYVRRINTGMPVDLKSPRVAAGLQYLKAQGVFGLDSAAADSEIARILANQLPA